MSRLLKLMSRVGNRPVLSIVVVVHRMSEQARRTLFSLSARHQRGVSSRDYEIVVVENASDRMLGASACAEIGANVVYFERREAGLSPAGAVNFGVERARGELVAIMIDGARMVTPGLTAALLTAWRITPDAVVGVPGYHLGSELQQRAVRSGYDERAEAALLDRIDWPSDGYRLFEIACLSGSCAGGFFVPMAESTCLGLSKRRFGEIGGCDEGFDLPGGGFVNLDLYRRACEAPGARLFVLPGEGTFHQFHGGVTTGGHSGDREQLIAAMRDQYRALRGVDFRAPARQAECLGKIPAQAQRFVQLSAQHAAPRPLESSAAAPATASCEARSRVPFVEYVESGLPEVDGWVPAFALRLAEAAADLQEELGVEGGACEIGIHHGRFFIGLALLLREHERALAIDLFDQQHLNLDGAGRGDRDAFLRNLERHGCDRSATAVYEGDSTALEPGVILDAVGRVRLFSVDGGHTASVVEHDLALAELSLSVGGVVFVSDYFNGAWPGVSEGVNRWFFSGTRGLEPVAIGGNKLLLAKGSIAEPLRDRVAQRFADFARKSRLFGADVIVLDR